MTVGSDGPFTGAATCMGYALFFKENTLHKLYGSKPRISSSAPCAAGAWPETRPAVSAC